MSHRNPYIPDPQRRTRPVRGKLTGRDPSGEVRSAKERDLDEVLDHIRQAKKLWGDVIKLARKKFENWRLGGEGQPPLPEGIQDLLRTIAPEESKGGTELPYSIFEKMVRRNYSSWGLDPLLFERYQTGDVVEDSKILRELLLAEAALATQTGTAKEERDGTSS